MGDEANGVSTAAFRPGSPGWRWWASALALASAAAVAGGSLAVLPSPLRSWAGQAVLVLAPLAAAAACLGARAAAVEEGRPTWLLLAVGSALAAVGQAYQALALLGEQHVVFPSLGFHLMVAFHVAFAEGALLALRPAHEGRLAAEISLDGALVLLGTSAIVLRFALDEPLSLGLLAPPQAIAVLVGEMAVTASLLFVALLVLWRDTALNGTVVNGLLSTVLLLALGSLPLIFAFTREPMWDASGFDLLRLAGWTALFITAGLAMARFHPSAMPLHREKAARRFRHLIIPGAALFLAAWSVDASRRGTVSAVSQVIIALMGLTLAARMGTALYAVQQESMERRRAEQGAAQARLRAVMARMNPHFLFNALHSLSALVRRDAPSAERALERLGKLLRYGLDSGDQLVTLRDEWDFAQSFLDLETLRLGSRLTAVLVADPEALKIPVPPFIVQPLVENAIRYAVNPYPEGGRVEVRALVRDEQLLIEVRDWGPGTRTAVLADAPGVGVRGVRAQLESHYGAEAHLEAEHPADGGLLMRLVIPADRD